MQTTNSSLSDIAAKLESIGFRTREQGSRLWINATPNGGKGQYGYLIATDDGTTGTCRNITKRAGEIAAALRA